MSLGESSEEAESFFDARGSLSIRLSETPNTINASGWAEGGSPSPQVLRQAGNVFRGNQFIPVFPQGTSGTTNRRHCGRLNSEPTSSNQNTADRGITSASLDRWRLGAESSMDATGARGSGNLSPNASAHGGAVHGGPIPGGMGLPGTSTHTLSGSDNSPRRPGGNNDTMQSVFDLQRNGRIPASPPSLGMEDLIDELTTVRAQLREIRQVQQMQLTRDIENDRDRLAEATQAEQLAEAQRFSANRRLPLGGNNNNNAGQNENNRGPVPRLLKNMPALERFDGDWDGIKVCGGEWLTQAVTALDEMTNYSLASKLAALAPFFGRNTKGWFLGCLEAGEFTSIDALKEKFTERWLKPNEKSRKLLNSQRQFYEETLEELSERINGIAIQLKVQRITPEEIDPKCMAFYMAMANPELKRVILPHLGKLPYDEFWKLAAEMENQMHLVIEARREVTTPDIAHWSEFSIPIGNVKHPLYPAGETPIRPAGQEPNNIVGYGSSNPYSQGQFASIQPTIDPHERDKQEARDRYYRSDKGYYPRSSSRGGGKYYDSTRTKANGYDRDQDRPSERDRYRDSPRERDGPRDRSPGRALDTLRPPGKYGTPRESSMDPREAPRDSSRDRKDYPRREDSRDRRDYPRREDSRDRRDYPRREDSRDRRDYPRRDDSRTRGDAPTDRRRSEAPRSENPITKEGRRPGEREKSPDTRDYRGRSREREAKGPNDKQGAPRTPSADDRRRSRDRGEKEREKPSSGWKSDDWRKGSSGSSPKINTMAVDRAPRPLFIDGTKIPAHRLFVLKSMRDLQQASETVCLLGPGMVENTILMDSGASLSTITSLLMSRLQADGTYLPIKRLSEPIYFTLAVGDHKAQCTHSVLE
eukprot:GHVU01094127.1.p1 GENE.GHVU01094127.1~~GHVU01094127.1.p1  ORF type:complete len:872 (-),score=81.36 GHVU01094127.1:1394-4009(-)